ncbi:hypothetical protein SDJN03_11161, partial [Cucurbita argyrosperma subsp. sororia]
MLGSIDNLGHHKSPKGSAVAFGGCEVAYLIFVPAAPHSSTSTCRSRDGSSSLKFGGLVADRIRIGQPTAVQAKDSEILKIFNYCYGCGT